MEQVRYLVADQLFPPERMDHGAQIIDQCGGYVIIAIPHTYASWLLAEFRRTPHIRFVDAIFDCVDIAWQQAFQSLPHNEQWHYGKMLAQRLTYGVAYMHDQVLLQALLGDSYDAIRSD